MAHFKVPTRVIVTDSLPKNPSGRILKRELRQQFSKVLQDRSRTAACGSASAVGNGGLLRPPGTPLTGGTL
jgi:hypothetical protein